MGFLAKDAVKMWTRGRQTYLDYPRRRSPSLWRSVARLIAHLCAAAIIVLAFMLLEWLIQYVFDSLNGLHKFHADLFRIITMVEISLTYVDWFVCIIVIGAGAVRFAVEVFRGDA